MTPTETLRAMLDERGVEYEGETDEDGWAFTRWHGFDDTGWLAASDELCGLLDLRGRYLFTPEQAIAATLGRGTCHDTGTFKSWGLFTCSNCSIVVPLNAAKDAPEIGKVIPLKFCPNCGARIEVGA